MYVYVYHNKPVECARSRRIIVTRNEISVHLASISGRQNCVQLSEGWVGRVTIVRMITRWHVCVVYTIPESHCLFAVAMSMCCNIPWPLASQKITAHTLFASNTNTHIHITYKSLS